MLLLKKRGKPKAVLEGELGLSHGLLLQWLKKFEVSESQPELKLSELELLKVENRRVKRLCQVLKVSRSAYYRWITRKASPRELEDAGIVNEIKVIFETNKSCYGMLRMRMALRKQGISISRGRVSRLMKVAGCQIKPQKAWKPCTTQSDCLNPIQSNHLDRDFQATEPRQKWMSDITYIPTKQGFLYLDAIIDLFSGKIVGLAMADHMQTTLVETAFDMIWQQERPKQLHIHHTDRGAQYTSSDYQALLTQG